MSHINIKVFSLTYFGLLILALYGLGFSATAQTNTELERLTREFVTYEIQQQGLVKAKTYFSPSAKFEWPNGRQRFSLAILRTVSKQTHSIRAASVVVI